MRTCILCAFAIATLVAGQASVATITFHTPTTRSPTAQEIAAGVPADAIINDYRVTTDADILVVGDVVLTPAGVGGQLYQVPLLGSDSEPPNPLLCQSSRNWAPIRGLPRRAFTSILGGGFSADHSFWGDFSNDGPQSNFLFARLTLGDTLSGQFTGYISLAGPSEPERFPFSLPINPQPATVPEPATATLLGIGLTGVITQRRRRA